MGEEKRRRSGQNDSFSLSFPWLSLRSSPNKGERGTNDNDGVGGNGVWEEYVANCRLRFPPLGDNNDREGRMPLSHIDDKNKDIK